MLMRTDPFRELDRFAQQVFGSQAPGTWSRPTPMPMDAYRAGDQYVVSFDLPGISPDAIDLDVERNVLTVKAERRPLELLPTWHGVLTRGIGERIRWRTEYEQAKRAGPDSDDTRSATDNNPADTAA